MLRPTTVPRALAWLDAVRRLCKMAVTTVYPLDHLSNLNSYLHTGEVAVRFNSLGERIFLLPDPPLEL